MTCIFVRRSELFKRVLDERFNLSISILMKTKVKNNEIAAIIKSFIAAREEEIKTTINNVLDCKTVLELIDSSS